MVVFYASVIELEDLHPFPSLSQRTGFKFVTAQQRFDEYAEYMSKISRDVIMMVAEGGKIGYLADYITQKYRYRLSSKTRDFRRTQRYKKNYKKLFRILTDEVEILKVESEIQGKSTRPD